MSTTIEALNSGGKRVRIHDAQLVVKLPGTAKTLVKTVADAESVSEATIVRWALAEYFEKRGYRS